MNNIDEIVNSLSPDEIETLNSDPQLLADFKAKYIQQPGSNQQSKKGILGQAWEDLKLPEEKSREGLKMLTDAGIQGQNWLANKYGLPIGTEPTGNMARDLIANTPRIAGETLTETAPSFVSRGAIVTGGLLKGAPYVAKAIGPGAGWVANQMAEQSGLVNKGKNLLQEEFQNPSLIFGPGKETANAAYDAIQAGNQQIRPSLKYTSGPIDFIVKAMRFANDGSLTTDEALEARHYLDGIKDSVTGAFYRNARGVLDSIAKQDYSGVDEAYQQAAKSEALRSLSSLNKTGGQSVLRGAAMLLKPLLSVAYSPAVQAGIAGTLGTLYKGGQAMADSHMASTAIPGVASLIEDLIHRKNKNQ